jgi:hypothetical protein
MSMDPYHFQMVLRMETMTHEERLAADEQAGRMAYGLWRVGRAVLEAVRGVRRPARLDLFRRGAAMRLRRNP